MHLSPHCDRAMSEGTSASKRLMFCLSFRFAAFKVDIVRSSPLALRMNQHKCSNMPFELSCLCWLWRCGVFVIECSWRWVVHHSVPRNVTGKHTSLSPFTHRNPREITSHKHSHNVALIGGNVTQLRRHCCHSSHWSSIDGYMVNKVKQHFHRSGTIRLYFP